MTTTGVPLDSATRALLARAGEQLNGCETAIVATEQALTRSRDLLVKLRRDVQQAPLGGKLRYETLKRVRTFATPGGRELR